MGADGRPCRWRAALIRTLLKLVEALLRAVGRVVILISKRYQRLSDLAAGTLLVSISWGEPAAPSLL